MNLETQPQFARVRKLDLTDFRSYPSLELELHAGQNVIFGRNGQGKSNILEALYAIASTRSFRGARDRDVVRHGCDVSTIRASVGDESTDLAIEYHVGGSRRAFINEQRLNRVGEIIGRLPAVVFSTTDLAMVDAGPSERRHFLDSELALLSPSYLLALAGYKKALEQRNAALRAVREGSSSADALAPWESALAAKGAALRSARSDWLAELLPIARREHSGLSNGSEILDAAMVPSDDALDSDELLAQLQMRRNTDIAIGHTTIGPHRDDMRLTADGVEARLFASQGQRRTISLALKLAVARYWKDRLGIVPLVLLDDIMSDLDFDRRQAVMAVSGKIGQVVITATDVDALRSNMQSDARFFEAKDGQVHVR